MDDTVPIAIFTQRRHQYTQLRFQQATDSIVFY